MSKFLPYFTHFWKEFEYLYWSLAVLWILFDQKNNNKKNLFNFAQSQVICALSLIYDGNLLKLVASQFKLHVIFTGIYSNGWGHIQHSCLSVPLSNPFFCVLEPNFGYFYYFILETVMIVYLCLLNCGLVSMRTSIVGNSSMAGIPSGFWAGFIVLDMYTSKHCIWYVYKFLKYSSISVFHIGRLKQSSIMPQKLKKHQGSGYPWWPEIAPAFVK